MGCFWSRARQGFTLTELAIVMAIAGMLVAATFQVAGVANRRLTLNRASEELGQIVNNMRSYYAGQGLPATPCAFATATQNQYASAGIFSEEMLVGSAPTQVANNPWAMNATSNTAQVDLCSLSNLVNIAVKYSALPDQSSCIDLLTRNSSADRMMGLQQIIVGTNVYSLAANTLPLNAGMTSTACAGAAPYTITWYYRLNN